MLAPPAQLLLFTLNFWPGKAFAKAALTWLDENGAPSSTKRAIAGHPRIKLEDRYNHASEDSIETGF
jgi:hypothetical protein